MDTQLLWGVEVWRLALAGALTIGAVTCGLLIFRLRGPARSPADSSGRFTAAGALLVTPSGVLLMLGLLYGAAALLAVPGDEGIWLGNVLNIAVVAAAAFLMLRVFSLLSHFSRASDSGIDDEQALQRFLIVLRIVVFLAAAVFVIDALGYPIVDQIRGLLGIDVLWGISVLRLTAGIILLLLGLWSRPWVRWVLRQVLGSLDKAGDSEWIRDAYRLTPYPLGLITHAALWHLVGTVLLIPEEPLNIRIWVTTALTVALVLAITFLVWRILDVISCAAERTAAKTQSKLDDQLIPLARKTIKIVVAIVVGVSLIEKVGYSATSLIASLGVGGLALALAAKDTIANLFGSFVVFADQPFQIGDGVKVGGVEGVVEEVGLRSTRIRGFDKTISTVPNQQFTSSPVVNLSQRPNRRIRFELGLSYDASAEELEDFLEAVRNWLKEQDGLDADTVMVHFTQFADSSLTVLIQVFTHAPDFNTSMVLQEEVLLGVMRLVETHGLDIAFPTRTVHVAGDSVAGADAGT